MDPWSSAPDPLRGWTEHRLGRREMRLVVALIAMIQAMLREGSEGPGPGWWFTFFIGKRWEKIRTNMKKGENDYRTWGGIHFIIFGNSLLDSRFWGFVWREQATSTQDLYNLDSACCNWQYQLVCTLFKSQSNLQEYHKNIIRIIGENGTTMGILNIFRFWSHFQQLLGLITQHCGSEKWPLKRYNHD